MESYSVIQYNIFLGQLSCCRVSPILIYEGKKPCNPKIFTPCMLFLGRTQNRSVLSWSGKYIIKSKLYMLCKTKASRTTTVPISPHPRRTFWLGRALQNSYFLLLFLDSHNLHRSQVSTNSACLASQKRIRPTSSRNVGNKGMSFPRCFVKLYTHFKTVNRN